MTGFNDVYVVGDIVRVDGGGYSVVLEVAPDKMALVPEEVLKQRDPPTHYYDPSVWRWLPIHTQPAT